MKYRLLLMACAALIFSCSSDDSTPENVIPSGDMGVYLPLRSGNYWNYDNTSTDDLPAGSDSLYVKKDTVIANKAYTILQVDGIPNGLFTGAISGSSFRKENNLLVLTGSTNALNLGEIPLEIAMNDFILLNAAATPNQVLSSVSGTFSQEVEGLPLTFDYTLTSTAGANFASHLSGTTTYQDVKSSTITLNLKISLVTSGITITVMAPQNVLTSTYYFAKNIGIIESSTVLAYTLQNFPGMTLPIPSSDSQSQLQVLRNYTVNE